MINGEVYVNATSFNEQQKLKDWKRSPKTQELIDALQVNENAEVEKSHFAELIISDKGGNGAGGKTWIHESLVLDFAQYISVSLRVWCQKQLATLLREGQVSIKQRTEESMLEELFPTSDKNLINLTADQIRTTKQLLIDLAEAKPKIDVYNKLVANPGVTGFQEMAQLLNISRKEFESKLIRLRILSPQKEIYSDYSVSRKYFLKGLSETYAKPTWYVTQKGVAWLAKVFKKYDDAKAW